MISRLLRAIPHGPTGDRLYALLRARRGLGYWPKLSPPRTFNEHFLWQKLHFESHEALARRLTDKADFKQWLHEQGLSELVVPNIGVYESAESLEGVVLPVPCVVKATHSNGHVMFVRGDTDRVLNSDELRNVRKWLTRDFYTHGREPNYRGLAPRILAEPLLPSSDGRAPPDYKFFCVYGRPFMIQLDLARFQRPRRRQMYNVNWQLLPFEKGDAVAPPDPQPRPVQLDRALALCPRLGGAVPLCRVDLYFLPDGGIRAGEITFFPGNCSSPFKPGSADLAMGREITRLMAGAAPS